MDWKQNTVVIPRMELCFHIQEKCASSSTKAALRQAFELRNGISHRDWPSIRDKIAFTGPSLLKLPNFNDYYRATIVRDPWARVLSAWKNKITPDGVLLKELDSQEYFEADESFESFVKKVCARPDSLIDRHLHLQTRRMFEGTHLIPRRFFQFEKLHIHWPILQSEVDEHCGLEIPDLPHLNKSGSNNQLAFAYTKELANMVEKRYERDLNIFREHGIHYPRPV